MSSRIQAFRARVSAAVPPRAQSDALLRAKALRANLWRAPRHHERCCCCSCIAPGTKETPQSVITGCDGDYDREKFAEDVGKGVVGTEEIEEVDLAEVQDWVELPKDDAAGDAAVGAKAVVDTFNGTNRVFLWAIGMTLPFVVKGYYGTSQGEISTVRRATRMACEAWNMALGGRLRFTETTDTSRPHITVGIRFAGYNGYANAFFPDNKTEDPNDYGYIQVGPSYITASADSRVNTMMHEIGHCLGLRHTHAVIDETGNPNCNIGEIPGTWPVVGALRRDSIMSYRCYVQRRRITEGDVRDVRKLYDRANENFIQMTLNDTNGPTGPPTFFQVLRMTI